MKIRIAILIIFVIALFTSEQSIAQFGFGLKVGYNASKLNTNLDSIKSSMNSGFHVGVFARVGKRVILQPEFYYTLSGATFENLGIGTVNDWKQKVTVGTLDIPVLLGFTIIKTNILKWRVMVGPEVSFVVNSKIEQVNLTGPIEKSDLRTTNWFIQAGTGIDALSGRVEQPDRRCDREKRSGLRGEYEREPVCGQSWIQNSLKYPFPPDQLPLQQKEWNMFPPIPGRF
jgi:hypothetical protein